MANLTSLIVASLMLPAAMPGTGKPSSASSVEFSSEIRNRIRVAVAAYAYEVENLPIISDAEFDELAKSIRPWIATGDARMDWFFLTEFSPHTGVWVHRHPGIEGLRSIFRRYHAPP